MKKFLMVGLVMFAILVFGSALIAADTSQPGSSKKAYDMGMKKPGSQPGTSGQKQGADTSQPGSSKRAYDMNKKKPGSQPGTSGEQQGTDGQQQGTDGQQSGKKPYTTQEPKKN